MPRFAAAFKFVIPTGADPNSYIVVVHEATYAAFRKERRMRFANAIKLYRKSGGAQGRDLHSTFGYQRICPGRIAAEMQNFLPGFMALH
jgi:hypothetical protein